MEKSHEYAAKLLSQIGDMLQNEDCENYINVEDFDEDENSTAFFHALINIMPTHLFNKFTGSDNNILEVNHIANQLIFQFSKKD